MLPVGVVAQGVLGGITVLLDLKWQIVIVHYLVSMALLVAGAVLVGASAATPTPRRR